MPPRPIHLRGLDPTKPEAHTGGPGGRLSLLVHLLTSGERPQESVLVSIFQIPPDRKTTRQAGHMHSQRTQLLMQVLGGRPPSMLGLVARMTSFTPPRRTRSSRGLIVRRSGPIPSMGDSTPCKT